MKPSAQARGVSRFSGLEFFGALALGRLADYLSIRVF
jgi:hypothetical protein